MKQVARIERKDGRIETVRVKNGAVDFNATGGTYNVARWGMRETWFGKWLEATYFEGHANPVDLREITLPNGAVIKRVEVAHPDDFTAKDYETLHGDPIVRWIARGMAQAQGFMIWIYVVLAAQVMTLGLVGWLAYHYYQHPWR